MATRDVPVRASPATGLDDVTVHQHTLRDVASPATGPLLGFLVSFAKQKGDYSDALRQKDHKDWWNIGRNFDSSIPDESAQNEADLLKLVNGSGLQPVDPAPTVTIVGAGVSGLVAGYELKRAGFKVRILEASSRVGGRVVTFREPAFAPGLHAEGGAMRIPGNHFLLHAYIKKFKIGSLFPFEMKNKFIYLSGYRGGTTLTYDEFDAKLVNKEPELLKLFPGLKDAEKGKTCDDLFFEAVQPAVDVFNKAYATGTDEATKIRIAYQAVTEAYDKYTLRRYLEEVAKWSYDAIRLFDLGNAHVVFENAFIESWKDAFLSSNTSGGAAGMQQLQGGMDLVPKAFISPDRKDYSLAEDITYGARVTNIAEIPAAGDLPFQVRIDYEIGTGGTQSVSSSYVIFAIPYGAQRAITKSRSFTPAQEQAIRDVRYVEVTKVLLQYQKRWWEDIFTRKSQGTDGGLVSDLPIRYTMFPKTADNEQFKNTKRGAVMAAYTFQQDATILGAMSPERQMRVAAKNLDLIFPSAGSLKYLEAGASQVFPSDDLAGGSAFCYFAPGQKTQYLETMCAPDWVDPADPGNFRVFFAGEHASYSHGWIHGAMEAGLRCVQQVYAVATSHIQG
ncbi:hypothetical protein B0T18DRAFT_357088 [Schizothecium vesticola]|uniref:Amine oxidase domain-containing protein n=1 Tax=Schizothecium vesticola TaxID=314040 RepID=A0AA40KBN2_9PEZI|nr:hypothetical protein B0T18DRAFT_357088 [Schizothecium vesticola]